MYDQDLSAPDIDSLMSCFDGHDKTAPIAVEDGLPVHRHAAFGLKLEDLDIVVIDESRAMQSLIRSMLQSMKPRRLRIHSTAPEALRDMLVEPPSLVLTELKMEPMSGYRLVKVMRHKSMDPLCFVPIIAITAHATRTSVENLLRAGTNAVMVKPLSANALSQRIQWLLRDARSFVPHDDSYIIDGVHEILDGRRKKDRLPAMIAQLHVEHDRAVSNARKAQNVVDNILNGGLIDGEVPEAALAASQNEQTGRAGMRTGQGRSTTSSPEATPALRMQPPVLRAPASRPILRPISRNTTKAIAPSVAAAAKTKEQGKGGRSKWQELWS